ncbi:MAG: NADH:flavin oxidoreductase [Planctomycetota bacterium]
MSAAFPKIAQLKSVDDLRARLAELGLSIPVDDVVLSSAQESPLAQPLTIGGFRVGNRWCIQPMEGWDAHTDGSPTEFTLRRWRRFGASGAKLIWGGEAAAVQPDGRANPRQTLAIAENLPGLRALLENLRAAHRESHAETDDLLVGLQLTHSGRFSKPVPGPLQPRIAQRHPLLENRYRIAARDEEVIWTDAELFRLVDRFVEAAGVAQQAGFHFVDIKACHGYLLHEFLGARQRPGAFGGDYAGRTRLLREIVQRVRQAWPTLLVGVRLSVFDFVPFEPGELPAGIGRPVDVQGWLPYELGFGVNERDPCQYDLTEPLRLLRDLESWGVVVVNLSCGSPYYNPHLMRPAAFPPSDGYQPPEDPLVGVARQIEVVRQCKQAVPQLPLVGSGYSYLQDYLPQVAQAVVRAGWVDSVGLGRMVLSYPELPADSLAGRPLARKRICRTFSDCTTAPRNQLISGCYPLDAHYKSLPEYQELTSIKRQIRGL